MTEVSEKVIVKFDNSKPVEVMDFLNSIHAFQKQYRKNVEEAGLKYNDDDIKLYIHVREGCLEWIFTTLKVKAIQDAFQFLITDPSRKLLKKTYDGFVNIIKKVEKEEDVEKEDISILDNTQKFIQPVKNDLASKFNFKYENKEEKIDIQCEIQGATGRGIYDKIREIVDKVKSNKNTTHEIDKEILQLKIHETNTGKITIKGIITEHSLEEKVVIFEPEIKQKILNDNKNNPFNFYYIVNGNIKKIDNKIIAYMITEVIEVIEENDLKEVG